MHLFYTESTTLIASATAASTSLTPSKNNTSSLRFPAHAFIPTSQASTPRLIHCRPATTRTQNMTESARRLLGTFASPGKRNHFGHCLLSHVSFVLSWVVADVDSVTELQSM